jgi:NADPH:quinone reductase-like Zn-dependent oxidoreductase
VQGLWLSYLSQKPEIMKPAWEALSQWIAERRLTPVVGHRLPMERAMEAYRLLQEGKNYGKVVLKIG